MFAKGLHVLVLEQHTSTGKGDHKSALGGIRAAHSELAKIILCKRSLEIFSTWKELHGDDVAWSRGGYCFPAYTEADESALKSLLPMQQQHGLNVHWVTPERVEELVPGITKVVCPLSSPLV